jgi:hypothetical protein
MVLPAILPGDELYNAQRVAGLTLRALVGWQQPADAPRMPRLAMTGVGIDIGGGIIILAGTVLRYLRGSIDDSLARWARDVRIVLVGDAAAAAVAAEPTVSTNVFLGNGLLPSSKLHALHAHLDHDFLTGTLQRLAPNTRELLALGVDAAANLDLARRVIALRRGVPSAIPLDRLYVRVDPRELRSSLGRDGFNEFSAAAADARLTSLPEARCRSLLRDQPPSKVRSVGREGRAAIVVIGLGETGLELLVRLCAQAQSPTHDPLVVVLTATEAPAVARELIDLWPGLSTVAELVAFALEPRLPQSAASLFRYLHSENLVPSCLYIALEDAALSAAWESEINLAVRLAGGESPLVLTVGHDPENDRLLLADEEVTDLLQREMHADHLRHRQDGAGSVLPAPVEWCRESFDFQEDNRSAADHLWAKARDLNLRIVSAGVAGPMPVDETRIEELAAAEHRRWVASRATAGWRFGATHAESARLHPCMVPWGQLIETERAKDREMIRRMPAILRAAGLSLQPLLDVAVPRTGLTETNADALAAQARALARSGAHADSGAAAHLIVAVEDARGFRLARRLATVPDIAISLVMAQSLTGLAVAAGLTSQDASQLARAAHTLWITRPQAFGAVFARWPALTGGVS